MRKTMLILFFLGLFGLPLLAQQEGENKRVKDYQSALEEGDRALKQKLYDLAVNYYNAALAFDPNQKEQIDSRIQVAFDSIKATVEAEKLKQIQILHQQKELRETTLKALYAEREAKINEEVAKKSQKEAEASKNIALSAEVSLKSEKRSAVRTLYYFNALEFAKYTGMISDKTLRKQIALTAFLLLDSTTSLITLGRTPLEVLKAMSEVQNGISLEKDGENTHITWANDSVFYFVSHRNRSHLYKVRLKHSKIIEAEIAEDSSFSKLPISKHYIKKMRF